LSRGLALEIRHNRVVDIESGLHMGSHIINMAIWQSRFLAGE